MLNRETSLLKFVAPMLVLLLAGCDRMGLDNGSVTIALPDVKRVQSLNAKGQTHIMDAAGAPVPQLNTLIVNVTGSGISSPIFYSWDAHDSSSSVAPTSVTLSVPQGSGRDIQVLAVYQTSGHMSFDYGSTTTDLSGSTASVDVPLKSIGASDGIQGNIVGRYLDTATQGPTDTLGIYFKPPGSTLSPIMVQRSEIIGGYFNIFGISDISFTYKLGSGREIFPDVTLNPDAANPLYAGYSNSSAVLYVPPVYSAYNNGNDTPSEKILFFGFYGPGVSMMTSPPYHVCSDGGGAVSDTFIDAELSTSLMMSGASNSPLPTLQGNLQAGIVNGNAGPSCGSMNYLKLTRDSVPHNDNILGIRGGYIYPSSTASDFLTFSPVSGGIQVNWTYAPGVFANTTDAITGSEVFYAPADPNDHGDNEPYKTNDSGYDCANLVSKYNFVSAGQLDYSTSPPPSKMISNVTMNSSIAVVVCPYRKVGSTVTYFQHGVESNPVWGNGGGGVMGHYLLTTTASPAPNVALVPVDHVLYNSSICQNFTLQVVDPSNKPMAVGTGSTPITLSLAAPAGSGVFGFGCGTVTDSFSGTLDATGKVQFQMTAIMSNVSEFQKMTVSLSTGMSNIPMNQSLTFGLEPQAGTPTVLALGMGDVPSTVMQGDCIPMNYLLESDSTMHEPMPSGDDVTFTLTGGGSYFVAADCSGTPVSSGLITAGNTMTTLYFQPANSSTVSVGVGVGGGLTLFNAPNSLNVESNSVSSITMSLQSGATAGCNPMNVNFMNSNSHMIRKLPNPVTASFNIPSAGSLFYTTPNCNGVGSQTTPTYTFGSGNFPKIYMSSSASYVSGISASPFGSLPSIGPFPTGSACGAYRWQSSTSANVSTDGCVFSALNSTGSTTNFAASATVGKGFGEKYYFEYKIGTFSSGTGSLAVGLGDSQSALAAFQNATYSGGNDTHNFTYLNLFASGGTGSLNYNNPTIAPIAVQFSGSTDVIGIAVDPASGQIWVMRDGALLGGASFPSTPTLTLGPDMIKHALYPTVSFHLPAMSGQADVTLVTKSSMMVGSYWSNAIAFGFKPLEP